MESQAVSYPKHIKYWQMSLQSHPQTIFSLFPFPPATHNFIPSGHQRQQKVSVP